LYSFFSINSSAEEDMLIPTWVAAGQVYKIKRNTIRRFETNDED